MQANGKTIDNMEKALNNGQMDKDINHCKINRQGYSQICDCLSQADIQAFRDRQLGLYEKIITHREINRQGYKDRENWNFDCIFQAGIHGFRDRQ